MSPRYSRLGCSSDKSCQIVFLSLIRFMVLRQFINACILVSISSGRIWQGSLRKTSLMCAIDGEDIMILTVRF
jgi:hypothetical protein